MSLLCQFDRGAHPPGVSGVRTPPDVAPDPPVLNAFDTRERAPWRRRQRVSVFSWLLKFINHVAVR